MAKVWEKGLTKRGLFDTIGAVFGFVQGGETDLYCLMKGYKHGGNECVIAALFGEFFIFGFGGN